MPSPEGLSIGLGETGYFGETRVSAFAKPEKPRLRLVASNTARHEATHAVVAVANGTGVRRVTIVPGTGYLGLTELSRPDPIAAVAPHAEGMSGTSHDIHITRLMGHDETSLAGTARSMAVENSDYIEEFALFLDRNKTAAGSDINRVKSEVDKRKRDPKVIEATLFIREHDGQERQFDVKMTKDKKIEMPTKVIDIFSRKEHKQSRKTLPPPANSDIFEAAA